MVAPRAPRHRQVEGRRLWTGQLLKKSILRKMRRRTKTKTKQMKVNLTMTVLFLLRRAYLLAVPAALGHRLAAD